MRPRQWSPVRLLVLGAGAGQLGLLAAARARGLFVIAVDRDPAAPGFGYADRRAIVSLDDEPALERLAEAERVDGVIAPGIGWAVGAAARIAARFGLPHAISPETAVLSSSRLRQRECLAADGVPQARWKLVTEADHSFGLPCLVRPPDRQGPRGLTVVRSRERLEPAVRLAIRASRGGLCLMEELADGPEVTVTAFSRDGVFHPLTATDRLATGHAWPRHQGHTQGHTLGLSPVTIAEAAARAAGIALGPSSTQVRIGPTGPHVVELGAHLGGAHDAELCEAALGVDLNALALAAAFGEEIPAEWLQPRPGPGGACVRFLAADPDSRPDPESVERARSASGVVWVRTYRAPDRAGAVLATGITRDEAQARAERAAQYVRFRPIDAKAVA